MNTIPKQSKIKLTFRNPPPPGYVTVKAQKMNAPEDKVRDGHASIPKGVDVITSIGELRNVKAYEARPDEDGLKQPIILDDRMLAVMLIFSQLGFKSRGSLRWSRKTLGMLPRFDDDGRLNTFTGHLGRRAWVYVDGAPHILLANSSYALVGNFPLDGPTATLRDDEKLPLFSVSERPFPVEMLDDNRPLDQLVALTHSDYLKIFVEPRNPRAVEKAKQRGQVERALKEERDKRTTPPGKFAAARAAPTRNRIPDYSPLQDLERRCNEMALNAPRMRDSDQRSRKQQSSNTQPSTPQRSSSSLRSDTSRATSNSIASSSSQVKPHHLGTHDKQSSRQRGTLGPSFEQRMRALSAAPRSHVSSSTISSQARPSQEWESMNGAWYCPGH